MSPPTSNPNSFNTLSREYSFCHPTKEGSTLPKFQELVAPAIESFDALFDESESDSTGLLTAGLKNIPEVVVFDHPGKDGQNIGMAMGNRLSLRITGILISRPMVPNKDKSTIERRIFPTEARERLATYKGQLNVRLTWQVNKGPVNEEIRDCGAVPIMVRSIRCNLRGLSSAKLVAKHEEAEEFGGYFIVNGNERLIRYTIVQRRNYPLAVSRTSFTKRGPTYTPHGVSIRSVRSDETSQTNTLHYCTDGSIMFRFHYMRREYLVPVMLILKALVGASDKEIFQDVVMLDYADTFLTDRIESLLRGFKQYDLHTSEQCLQFLGEKFRQALNLPEDYTNLQLGQKLLEMVVLVHLDDPRDKYHLLVFMLRKLMALVSGKCGAENADSPANQEILMPGSLYASIVLEQCYEVLLAAKAAFLKDLRRDGKKNFTDSNYILKILQKVRFGFGDKLTYFLSTGTIPTRSGLDLQQVAGYTIVAEKLNWYRYLSHFRSVHRGSFFQEMRTTTVRKLLPEAWGFLCPVHTPDGTPCGLLNHFARECRLVTQKAQTKHIPGLLSPLGMTDASEEPLDGRKHDCIQLDGRIIGWATADVCRQIATALREWKTEGENRIPFDLEIALVPPSNGGQYPGLYLFSGRARMMRTVRYLANGKDDSIGSFEQVYMNIAIKPEDIPSDDFTHVELDPTNFLSILASLTPFSDYNQSPRNIYQCQMGKQSMGTASTALMHRTDNKLYRLQSPQTPIVRPEVHNTYGMDCFPNGANAVVAVISYTGYDMEDAMILNKSAHERGFGHGYIYKSLVVDLRKERGGLARGPPTNHFGIGTGIAQDHPVRRELTHDGLPMVGNCLMPKQGYLAAYINDTDGRTHYVKYKGDEVGYVDMVRLIGEESGESQVIQITVRIPRSPVIGDKFSSRHGQKGVCSQKWPAIDMPFSESGIQPDVIINPHAFPSRMTIGMFVESMAGKAGVLLGIPQDATPFKFDEQNTAVDYFGKQLQASGYNYYGNEPMYSGITGKEFHADIYFGVVYYQRLRHMVLDKFQVRTTGPIDQATRQPIKGRKRGGGIRFGEMERDALLAHGTSFLLQDRLMNCSDYSTAWVCRTCGSLISIGYEDASLGEVVLGMDATQKSTGPSGEYCRVCRAEAEDEARKEREALANGEVSRPKARTSDVRLTVPSQNVFGRATKGGDMDIVAIPFVFRYLCAELAAMGIKVSLECN